MNKEVEIKISKNRRRKRNKWIRKQQLQTEHNFPSNINVSNSNRNSFRCPFEFYNSDCFSQRYINGRNDNNLPRVPSGFSLPGRAFRSDNESYCLGTSADNSANNDEFRKDGQFLQQTCSVLTCESKNTVFVKSETNLSEKEKSFQEDIEIFFAACQNVHSQSRTPDFYLDKMNNLNKNYIQELLKEKDKLNKELQQAQKKLKENHHLTMKRLNTIENILCSSTVLNKFLALKMEEIIVEEKRAIKAIRIKLTDSVGCNINSSIINNSIFSTASQKMEENEAKKEVSILRLQLQLPTQNKQKTIAKMKKASTENNIIHRQLKRTQDELRAVKKELEDKIITIRQHAYHEQQRNLEINKLKSEVNMFQIQLTQSKDKLETVSKELNDRMNPIQQSPESEQMVVQLNKTGVQNFKSKIIQKELSKTQQELMNIKKILNFKTNTIQQKVQHEQKLMEQLNKAEGDVYILRNQLAQTLKELRDIKKELNDKVHTFQHNIQHEQEEIEFNKTREELQNQLTGTQHELEEVRKELSNNVIAVQQRPQQGHIIMAELNKAEVIPRNQLIETQDELREVRKELRSRSDTIEQKTRHEQKIMEELKNSEKEVNLLRSQLIKTQQELTLLGKELSNKAITIQEKAQYGQKVMEELDKAEEEINILRNQLTGAQHELREVRKELSCKSNTIQQKTQHEHQIMEELNKAEEELNILRSQLTKTLHEFNESRKELCNMGNTLQQKAQQEQKTMIELSKTAEEVKVLRSQLAGTQHELEAVRKELNDRVNSMQRNAQREQKVMEVAFSEIRLMLINKLGFTGQNGRHFENYMKEGCCRGIVSDIRRLIEEKVQLWDEHIPKNDIGSNILKVTENEVHLVISIASFLKTIPFSASTDFIYSFVVQIDNVISHQHMEGLLKKFPTLFKNESVSTGSLDEKWRYLDLTPIVTI